MDQIDCGSFFDHFDDLLVLPSEDIEAGLSSADCNSFPSIWPTQTDSVFFNNSSTNLSAGLSVPYEDIVQLEWLSNFDEDSSAGGNLTISNQKSSSITKDDSSQNQLQTCGLVSDFESSSSCTGDKTVVGSAKNPAQGRRGLVHRNRPRPPKFNRRPLVELVSLQFTVPKVSSDFENSKSHLVMKVLTKFNSLCKMKKKIRLSAPQASDETKRNPPTQAVRKCMHCEITKTPQWRTGPMGPKTLCNACGVRYKSGRLLPEYRPAASPAFVPSLHSNSHKKVFEMRSKICEKSAVAGN
ncbi:GATA transcription factor [Melia azedarach]|uniref:GATA transcription factor n=1 Tax=Melia azedarach TaxID=155640 RepID=A0ACC1YBG3_MELAZ|nr:GATA transcription factor [Melia azedarach]